MVKGATGIPTMNVITSTGTVPALRVNDDGKVGVGTATPGAKLMVKGEAGSPTLNIVSPTDGMTTPSIRVTEDGKVGVGTSTPGAKLMVKGATGIPTMNVITSTGTVPALRVNDDGKVGVGTATPKSKLEVSDGDVYLSNHMNGVILKSMDGTCYRITVANDGTLVSTSMVCPN
jgi:Cu/Zn superoxide dismutase